MLKAEEEMKSFTWHCLKIKKEYADAVYDGTKPFEVRLNDRDYQVNDCVVFSVIDDVSHPLNNKTYVINYILKGGEYGLDENYVVFSIKERPDLCASDSETEREAFTKRWNGHAENP